ncbi:MAG: class B sortase [Bariatricus sp.]|nr:class B sortase [Bariatricus sp.]
MEEEKKRRKHNESSHTVHTKKKVPHRGRRKRKKRYRITAGTIVSKIILIIALAVFAYSAFQLFEIYYGYHEGEAEYEEIEKAAISIDNEEDDRYRVDFDALKEINPDVVAWIRFDEPAIINYPVVQGQDNEEYLHKTFKGYDNTVGSIFVNVDNNPDFSDRNTIIYGHHMNNGTMFNELEKYEDKEFWEKYPCFYIYTPDGAQLKYHIYSVGIVKDVADNYMYQFADDDIYQKFLNTTKESALYDTGIIPDLTSKIVTLSTCTKANNDERLVVHGLLAEVKN